MYPSQERLARGTNWRVDCKFQENFQNTDKLLTLNREDGPLSAERILARNNSNSRFKFQNILLLYDDYCLILPDANNFLTILVQDAHNQPSTTNPGLKKILKLLASTNYWQGMGKFIKKCINNSHTCKEAHFNNDETPGLLYPLQISTYPW